MSFENPTKEKDPLLGEEQETDISGLMNELEKKDPSISVKINPEDIHKEEESDNLDQTQPYLPLSDRQINMIMDRMEQGGIGSEEAIRELQSEGAFNNEPDRPFEKMVEELNRELEEQEDGVAA